MTTNPMRALPLPLSHGSIIPEGRAENQISGPAAFDCPRGSTRLLTLFPATGIVAGFEVLLHARYTGQALRFRGSLRRRRSQSRQRRRGGARYPGRDEDLTRRIGQTPGFLGRRGFFVVVSFLERAAQIRRARRWPWLFVHYVGGMEFYSGRASSNS